MIKKSIDKITATEKQKKDIYERICADYEKSEKTEKKTKNNFLKYGTMAAATVLVLGAVAVVVSVIVNMQGVPVTHPESGGTQNSSSDHTHSSGVICDCGQSTVPDNSGYDAMAELEVDTKPVFMAWYTIEDDSTLAKTFKMLYGTPELPSGYENEPMENAFCNVQSFNYADRYHELTELISSDQSPDIFPYESCAYPYGIYRGLFQSVDNVIDFSGSMWELHNKYADKIKWKGETYVPIISLEPYQYLWYKKSVIEDYGLADPYTLYKEGKWDWGAFLDISNQYVKSGENLYAIDGYRGADSFVCAAGKAFFDIENGMLKSHLYDAGIEQLMDTLMTELNNKENQLRYPMEIENNWNPNRRAWVNGNTLFFADGSWRYEEDWYKYKKMYNWSDDEVQFVPFPKADNSDSYYYNAKINSYMLCTGSKNTKGYAAFVYSALYCENDKSIIDAERKSNKENFNWTDDLLDRLCETTEPSMNIPVFDAIGGIEGTGMYDTAMTSGTAYLEMLRVKPYRGTESYIKVRGENEDMINRLVDKVNE